MKTLHQARRECIVIYRDLGRDYFIVSGKFTISIIYYQENVGGYLENCKCKTLSIMIAIMFCRKKKGVEGRLNVYMALCNLLMQMLYV